MTTSNEFEPGGHFRVGGQRMEYVEVWVISRSPEPDYWDGNWLSCKVSLAAGGFGGRYDANLRTEELEQFHSEVQALYDSLIGVAHLRTMEEQLTLELEGDGRGHILCRGEGRDRSGTGNVLRFELALDQTQLFGTMVQLSELLTRYPVRGSPAA
jgi:hypothetical protein